MKQASDTTNSHPLLEKIQDPVSLLHTDSIKCHYFSTEPPSHPDILCSVIKCNDTTANDELWFSLEIKIPNGYLHRSKHQKVSTERGSRTALL